MLDYLYNQQYVPTPQIWCNPCQKDFHDNKLQKPLFYPRFLFSSRYKPYLFHTNQYAGLDYHHHILSSLTPYFSIISIYIIFFIFFIALLYIVVQIALLFQKFLICSKNKTPDRN